MRLRKYLLPVAVIFMVMAFFSCSYNPAEYFPLNEGDEWTYEFTLNGNTVPPLEVFVGDTEEVNGVEAIRYNMSSPTPDEYDYYCFTLEAEDLIQPKIYWATFGIYIIMAPPRMVFPANFKLGEVYEQSYGYTQHSIDDDSILGTFTGSETITLESIEDVTVPSGTFKDCLKVITSTYSQSGDWVESIDEITWYAHRVGMVKHDITFYQLNHPVQEDMETAITHELSDYNVEMP
jgi:hypothetical protein